MINRFEPVRAILFILSLFKYNNMAKKKLTNETGKTFVENVIKTVGEVGIQLLLKKLFGGKTRGVESTLVLTDDQVNKLNDLL